MPTSKFNGAFIETMIPIVASADRLYVCDSEPRTFDEIISREIASTPITPGIGNGFFSRGRGLELHTSKLEELPIKKSGYAAIIILTANDSDIIFGFPVSKYPLWCEEGGSLTIPEMTMFDES